MPEIVGVICVPELESTTFIGEALARLLLYSGGNLTH